VSTPIPPANWYPDPWTAGLLRWWDGRSWTHHVHPPATASQVQAPVATPAQYASEQTQAVGAPSAGAQATQTTRPTAIAALGAELSYDGIYVVIDAQSLGAKSALGSRQVTLPVSHLTGVHLEAHGRIRPGSLIFHTSAGALRVQFTKAHADGIGWLHGVLTSQLTERSRAHQNAGATVRNLNQPSITPSENAQTTAQLAPVEPVDRLRPRRSDIGGPGRSATVAPPRRGAAWIAAGQSVRVGDFVLPGLVYVGNGLEGAKGRQSEPALIDPTLPIKAHRGIWCDDLGYWPSYAQISPAARGAYLSWLASGRRQPVAPPVGFAFLFFYGLERRVALDAAAGDPAALTELPQIAAEVDHLKAMYSGDGSMQRYAQALLDVIEFLSEAAPDPATSLPPIIDERQWPVPLRLKIGLGEIAQQGIPLPAAWALAWVTTRFEVSLRTPATRCREEFTALFALKYRQRFGNGLLIRPLKKALTHEYYGANAELGHIIVTRDIPDVFDSAVPIKKLTELVNTCTDDLDAYSRWLGRNPEGRESLAAAALLPPALIQVDPRVQDLTATLEERLAGKDQALTDGAQLATLLCGDTQLTKKDAVSMAQLLSACGFGIEPDVRMGGPILGPGPAVLFREDADAAPSASPAYSSASTLLTLAVAVASADGVTSSVETAHLVAQLEGNLQLTRSEQRRLRAHLEYLTATGVKLTGLQRRMNDLTRAERESIGDFVTAVAAADGVIDPAEVTILTKIYKLLGLDPETVFQKLHVAAAPVAPRPVSEPVTVRPASPEDGYAIPARPRGRHATASESPGLLLNPDLIESKLAETHAVAALLTTIFVDDETPPSPKPNDSRLDGAAATAAAGGTQLLMAKAPTVTVEGLDANHSTLLLALQDVTTVSRSHFDELAAEHSLMPEGAIDVLNEASYEASGEPVLDGDDPMEVNSFAMKELFS
jgi:uncharacterized tellurite resistance protein B-like protein